MSTRNPTLLESLAVLSVTKLTDPEDVKTINAAIQAIMEDTDDAGRYRFIRDRMERPETGQPVWMRRGADLDEAIDAAMLEQPSSTGGVPNARSPSENR